MYTSKSTYLDQAVVSTGNEVGAVGRDVHAVDGACLGSFEFTDGGSVKCLEVSDLAVCASGDDLVLLWVVAHILEESVDADHLASALVPIEQKNVTMLILPHTLVQPMQLALAADK